MSIPVEYDGHLISFPSEMLLIIMGLLTAGKMIFTGLPERRALLNPLSLLIIMDIGWTLVTTITSSIPEVSLKRFVMKLFFIIVFYFSFISFFQERKNIKLFFLAYGLGMVLPVINTLWNHSQFGFVMIASFYSPLPFFPEHTIYAASLTFILTALLIIVLYQSKDFKGLLKAGLWMLICLIVLADYFSFSRAAWISLVISLIIGSILTMKVKPAVLWFSTIIFISMLLFNIKNINEEMKSVRAVSSTDDVTEHIQSLANISNDASNAERLNRWSSAYRMFLNRPFFGFGPGTFQFNYGIFQQPEDMTRISTFMGDKGNSHSEYFNVLSETGIPGLLIFISILVFSIRKAYLLFLYDINRDVKILALMVIICLIGYFLHGIVNSFLDSDKIAVLVYGSMAIITALFINQPPDEVFNQKNGDKIVRVID